MIKILQKEDRKLREISKPVSLADVNTPKIQKIIADMKEAMRGEADAVAIAAPQIGVMLRIFIVSGQMLTHLHRTTQTKRGQTQTDDKQSSAHAEILRNSAFGQRESADQLADQVFINPELLKCSKKEGWAEEGCLSVRWLYGEVRRSEKATVRAYDENGKLFTRGASGILAQVFQHEIEHLDGKLFTDKARNVQDIPPDKLKAVDPVRSSADSAV